MTNNQIAWINAQETQRSNLARESEMKRSNMASEELGRATLDETRRANSEKELENIRHNRASENITLAQLAETKRSNTAREYETYRTNRNAEILKQIDQNNVTMGQLYNYGLGLKDLEYKYHKEAIGLGRNLASTLAGTFSSLTK